MHDTGKITAGLEMPWNIEAEQGLLGALFIDARALEDVAGILLPGHFYAPAHQRIYQAILDLNEKGKVAGPVTLKNQFEHDGDLESVGGAGYLAELAASCVTVINAVHYAQNIRDLALRRDLITACQDAAEKARKIDVAVPAVQVMDDLESQIFTLSETGQSESGPVDLATGLTETLDLINLYQKGEIRGVKTGIAKFDEMTNGLHAGHLIILAGRPSMGKSAMAITIAHNVAQQEKSVLFYSMEMLRTELIQRLYARYTSLATGMQMRPGSMGREHWQTLQEAQGKMRGLKLSIDDTAALSVAQIRSRSRRHKRKHGLDLIVIDQLTKIPLPEKYPNKVDQIGFITNALKDLAKDLNVPIVLLHQLSRKVEERDDKRPQMADLRDSGNIEQDADAVVFLYRDEYYLERSQPKRSERDTDEKFSERLSNHRAMLDMAANKGEAIIAKFRQGKVGTVDMQFDPTRQVFFDYEGGR